MIRQQEQKKEKDRETRLNIAKFLYRTKKEKKKWTPRIFYRWTVFVWNWEHWVFKWFGLPHK